MKRFVLWTGVAIILAALAAWQFFPRKRAALIAPAPSAAVIEQKPAPMTENASVSPARGAVEATSESKTPAQPPGSAWDTPEAEPAFEKFAEWTRRYRSAASAAEKTALEAEGTLLAAERREALAELIQTDPKRALELAVPFRVRQSLPANVSSLLEERVNAHGDLMVVGGLPLPGREQEVKPLSRSATIEGKYYDAYPYGWWTNQSSKYNVAINGIAVPRRAGKSVLAVSPALAQLPDDAEEKDFLRRKAIDPVCSISGQLATSRDELTVVKVGNEVRLTCGLDHAVILDEQLVKSIEKGLGDPASGGSPLAGYDNYTTGRKRFLIMRPRFADVTDTMTDAQVPGHFNAFSNNMYQMSWGKLVFAGLGQGSDVTPIMLLPGNAADYDNTGLGKLYDTCKSVAQANYGFNLSQYDFFYVVTGAKPAAGYAGLGFVRGVGFHLANSYYGEGTASHEYGHNLGLNHANFWSTGGKTIIGSGNSVEYGDGNDPMGGGGGSPQQYGSRYKNYLTWIAGSDVATVTSANSGTYRLYASDEADVPGGIRGVKVVRTGSQNYWVQFRQRFGGKAMLNGVQVLWTGNGNQSSLLLDTRLKDGSDDNALAMGRTFSDTAIGMHITPIGKGHTAPESMDVVVNVGSFPANLIPSCVVGASTTNAGSGQTITFTASASDPNGDPLAYFWDFGDGDYSVDNSAVTTHSFAADNEYVVQCTVSDMKGGTARDSVLVRIGNPATFRISGRVLRLDQRGFPGVKVSADGSHFGVSDTDGAYTIAGLGGGTYNLSVLEPVSGTPTFIHPFFANPVTVGPSATAIDFLVGTNAPPVTLVPTGSVWKYLDTGVNLGTAWRASAFNDSAWASGPGELGYGENDEATVVSYGPNANAKYTTTYFRRAFNVADAATLTNAMVSLLRDDGGIVYLNGVEIFRSNMPTGAVTYTTFASSAIDDQVFFTGPVPSGLLVTGNNVLAVEIHQADLTTSDASFDLSLTAENTATAAQGTMVYITSPDGGSAFTTPANLTFSAVARTTTSAFTNVEFIANGIKQGEDSNVPYTFAWNSVPAGNFTLSVRAKNTNGQIVVSAPVTISVAAPSTVPPAVALSLISTGATWRYLSGASAAPANWATAGFSDSAWASGGAQLGFGDGDETTVINGGPSGARYATIYFRRPFTINDPGAVTNLTLQLKRDDGAVVYLNGVEVLRDNMPLGAITYSTLATNAADDGASFFTFALDPASLLVGSNLVAVEVHQSALSSSDLSFDLALDALASTNRPRGVYIASPLDGTTVASPDSVTLVAQPVAGGTLGVAKVEFYGDGVKLGEDSTAPYSLVWSNLLPGARQIFAVATDSAGGSITSAPVSILVTPPPLSTQLISAGEVWKFLDNGTDPGTAWRSRTFNDGIWDEGAARLGYGGDGEVTTVSYGPDANNRYISTYFRHAFTVANPAAFTSLKLHLIRDDGAVVYLNGTEVFRSNMATGLISANSLALLTVNAPDETTFFEATLSPGGLLAGTNVIAVEVHQAAVNSSDIGFDLALVGLTDTNVSQGVFLSAPANGTHYDMPAAITLSAFAAAAGGVSKVEFFDGGNKLGEVASAPFNFTWNNPATGSHTLTARATDNTAQTFTSPPAAITVGPATLPSTSVATTFFPLRSTWTYLDDGSNQGSNWTSRTFDASTWKTGTARFGYGLDGESTRLGTNITTHYFRKWFTVANPGTFTELLFRLQRDDGAVIHLNGQEIYRSNMPTGAINSATLAATTANALDENYVFETIIAAAGSGLLAGSNLVAVELHQSSATSSDAGFDLELSGAGTTEPRVYLANPADGADCPLPVNVRIDANAWAGAGRFISKVEFFDGASKIGEGTSAPYSLTLPNPPAGTHVLSAVATDNGGRLITSDPVTITVSQPPLQTMFIAAGSIWKYLDNGSNQGTNWSQRSFSDSSWASGPAELGYSNSPVTVVSFGPNPASKYITTYFRRWFNAPTDAVFTNLDLRLKCDDGAVIYLNGREISRSNMPTGPITYTSTAPVAIGGADEETFFASSILVSNIVAGTNLLAVEVHQNAGNSSDLGFDLELVGVGYSVVTAPPKLAIEQGGAALKISWPASATGGSLYSAPSLNSPINWSLVGGGTVSNGVKSVTIVPSGSNVFYQLRSP